MLTLTLAVMLNVLDPGLADSLSLGPPDGCHLAYIDILPDGTTYLWYKCTTDDWIVEAQ